MARDHAQLNVTIWGDPDWRKLPPAGQHLYMALWSSPDLTYCGVHDWRPARLNGLWSGFSINDVRTTAAALHARHFLVIDEGTEEALIRSWVRFDGLMKHPKMAISCIKAYSTTASSSIRQVLIHELRKIRNEHPEYTCWKDSRVAEVLDHPAVSAKDLPVPDDPFTQSVTPSFANGLPNGFGEMAPAIYPTVYPPPTPAPTPTPKPSVVKGGVGGNDSTTKNASRKRPAKQLPNDWQPNDGHRTFAAENGIDLEAEADQFRDHAEANDRRQADWDAAFRTWLRNAVKFDRRRGETNSEPDLRIPNEPVEQPPNGLTDDQMRQWWVERKARLEAVRASR